MTVSLLKQTNYEMYLDYTVHLGEFKIQKNIELKLAKQFFSLPWSILMTTNNFSSLGQREDPALAHEDFTIWAHKVENDKTKKGA